MPLPGQIFVLTFVVLFLLEFPLETLLLVGRVLGDLLVGLVELVERPGAAHGGVVHDDRGHFFLEDFTCFFLIIFVFQASKARSFGLYYCFGKNDVL